MTLPGARDKVDEATFFLGHMRSEGNNWQQYNPNVFRYYLSAFLNACYSVRDRVEKDFKAMLRLSQAALGKRIIEARFLAAEKEWETVLLRGDPADRALWGFIGKLRDVEVHEHRASTVVKKKQIPHGYGKGRYEYYSTFSQPALTLPAARQAFQQDWLQAWREAEEHHFEIHDQVLPVIDVCERYLGILNQYVAHFENCCEKDMKSSKGGAR